MTKDHILQDCIRHAHQHRYLAVHLGTVLVDADLLAALILRLQDLFEFLEFLLLFFIQQLETSHGEYGLVFNGVELQLDACLRLGEVADARVVHERLASVRVRRHGA